MDAGTPTPQPGPQYVKHGDVMPYAKKSCKTCYGVGEIQRVVGTSRVPKICGCALRRFLQARARDVVPVKTGELAWRVPQAEGVL